MNNRSLWSHFLVIVGLAVMLIGAIDPLEGSLIILPGVGMIALGALLGKSRYRTLLYWSFVLVLFGVGAMVVLTWFGGIGGNTGHSMWWGLVILPFPAGWVMGLACAILRLIESFRRPVSQISEV